MKEASKIPFSERVLQRLHGPEVVKSHRKQAQILEAFAQCLIKKGLADTSYSAVGEIAGMGAAHISYYFPTWESMLLACFQYVIATAQQITIEEIASAKSPQDCLRAMCDAPFLHFKRFPQHSAVLVTYQLECARNGTFRAAHRKIRKQGRDRIRSFLDTLIPHPNVKQDLDAMALAIQSIIVGSVSEWVSGRSSTSTSEAQSNTWLAVDALLTASFREVK
jgi:AcrR family transcriptional regulator